MTYTPMVGAAFVRFVRGSSAPITLTASVPWPVRGGQIYAPSLVPEVVLPGGVKC